MLRQADLLNATGLELDDRIGKRAQDCFSVTSFRCLKSPRETGEQAPGVCSTLGPSIKSRVCCPVNPTSRKSGETWGTRRRKQDPSDS